MCIRDRDEAHHSFTKATEAVRFYRETMRPDFTLMITATPDDQDVEKFKKAASIGNLHRIRVSRKEAVDAGLIKDGIKSIAYLAADDQRALVDFANTALADGWSMHSAIKQGLQAAGIGLVPLMLLQVGNSNAAVDEARTRLLALGVEESKIAWYTAADPNDDLLAVAIDEQKEVLIFKVAVALGFDAPRAFTPVSYTHLDVYKRQARCTAKATSGRHWHRRSDSHRVQSSSVAQYSNGRR